MAIVSGREGVIPWITVLAFPAGSEPKAINSCTGKIHKDGRDTGALRFKGSTFSFLMLPKSLEKAQLNKGGTQRGESGPRKNGKKLTLQ